MAENPSLHAEKCNSIFHNLLRVREDRDVLATTYVREFFDTQRCDDVKDFAPRREEYSRKLKDGDADRLDRILKLKETEEDLRAAVQAMTHYHAWHEKKLVEALNWRSWLTYYTVDKAERTLARVGIGGASYGALSVIRNTTNALKTNMTVRNAVSEALKKEDSMK